MKIEAEYVRSPPVQACIVLDLEDLKMLKLLAGSVCGTDMSYRAFFSELFTQLGDIGVPTPNRTEPFTLKGSTYEIPDYPSSRRSPRWMRHRTRIYLYRGVP